MNIYFIIIDNSAGHLRGAGTIWGKNGGYALLTSNYFWAMAHELGHAFGLEHDFNDGAYIMSYGWGSSGTDGQLSPCHTEYLSVHSYFNPDTPIDEEQPPTIDLISPRTYPAGSQSVPVRLKVNDSEGLHHVLLFVRTIDPHSSAGFLELKACRGLAGERDTVVKFDYDGVIPSNGFTSLSDPVIHPIYVHVVDTDGNVSNISFGLTESSPYHIATLEGHTDRVTSVAFSPVDATLLATGSWDRTVKLWDVETLQDIATLEGHTSGVSSVVFSRDGSTLATGSWDRTVKLWDMMTRVDFATPGHTSVVTSVAFSSDGVTLASGTGEGTIELGYTSGLMRERLEALAEIDIRDPNLRAAIATALGKPLSASIVRGNMVTLTELYSVNASISDLTGLEGASKMTSLRLPTNNISDISPLVANTGLGSGDEVYILGNPLSYPSIYTHIPVLQERGVEVFFDSRTPHRIRTVSGDNQKGLPSAVLEQPLVVEVQDERGVAFEGVPVTFTVTSGGGTLSATSTATNTNGRAESTLTLGSTAGKNSVRISVEGISQLETFTAVGIRPQFDLSLPAGISLIHIPIRATAVDDAPLTIESMSDLYDALGGAEKVNFLVTRDAALQRWRVYFGSQNRGTSGDQALTDDLGIIAAMKDAVTIRLAGDSLGRNGNSTITLHRGTNLVGVPLRDSRIMRVSDLLSLEGIRGNVPSIFVSAQGKFVEVRRAADDGNISITGGQSFVLEARDAATVAISGNAWYNTSGTTAAPSVAVTGIEAGDVTLVLAFSGSIVDEVRVWSGRGRDAPPTGSGFRVTVKNLSTSKAVTAVTGDEHLSLPDKVKLIGVGYQLAVVDMESGRAAQVGDVLEVSAKTSNPLIRVRSLRYTVTAADVRNSRILLPELVAYEIPTETALLPNYPNPFNPETWIPYRLAEDADVTLTIYDTKGVTVRRLDLGHQLAGYYADRGKAAYWDGRNDQGESVASGLYFYQLGTPSFRQLRRMVIIK